jgi:hypothetical protein
MGRQSSRSGSAMPAGARRSVGSRQCCLTSSWRSREATPSWRSHSSLKQRPHRDAASQTTWPRRSFCPCRIAVVGWLAASLPTVFRQARAAERPKSPGSPRTATSWYRLGCGKPRCRPGGRISRDLWFSRVPPVAVGVGTFGSIAEVRDAQQLATGAGDLRADGGRGIRPGDRRDQWTCHRRVRRGTSRRCRHGNKSSAAGAARRDDRLEADNVTQSLRAQGAWAGNPIERITDYGLEAGGPITRGRAWVWGAYGRQDITVGVVNFYQKTDACAGLTGDTAIN